MDIDSILGLQEITQYVNESFQKHTLSKQCGFILIQEITKLLQTICVDINCNHTYVNETWY